MKEDYIKELEGMAQEQYRQFVHSLIPNEKLENIMGVRLPKIRLLAKRIARTQGEEFLNHQVGNTLEEKLLHAFVIAYADMSVEQRLRRIKLFIPYINSWSVCDSFVVSLKFIENNKEVVWDFLTPYFYSSEPYYVRFAVVTALNYFNEDNYIYRLFEIFPKITNEDYYVKMAIAWCLCEMCSKYPQQVLDFLKQYSLSEDTHNKTIRKIKESYKIVPEYKEKAKKLKR